MVLSNVSRYIDVEGVLEFWTQLTTVTLDLLAAGPLQSARLLFALVRGQYLIPVAFLLKPTQREKVSVLQSLSPRTVKISHIQKTGFD